VAESERSTGATRLRATVHGRVQGVGYRYYALRRARERGLVGYVRNLWDGTVEVVAEGPRGRLDEMLTLLRAGPTAAFVTHVDVQWEKPTGAHDRFEVRA